MRAKEFDVLGSTACCTIRGVQTVREYESLPLDDNNDDEYENDMMLSKRKQLYMGDSWFGLVKTVLQIVKMGHHAIMNMKTAHKNCPNFFGGKHV